MDGLVGEEQALPAEAPVPIPNTASSETELPIIYTTQQDVAPEEVRFYPTLCSGLKTKMLNVDRRIFYMLGMLVSILHPIIALYMVTYKDCPLDDAGNPIPGYEPPKPCQLDDNGNKVDPLCTDPPEAYARVENICFMYLANEFVLHVTYVLYVKVWTTGGRSVGAWREMIGFASYFVVEFIVNAAPYHVQTFPAFRDAFPFLYHFNWPLYAAFIFGSILLLPLGFFLARTRDQKRRASLFLLPGIVFFGVDVFNRTIFLPFFETMQHKFAQLELHSIITFVGELALANFYGSIFLPATHKAAIIFAEFGYNVSYLKNDQLPPQEEDISAELIKQESDGGVNVLLELEGPSGSEIWRRSPRDDASGLPMEARGFSHIRSARPSHRGDWSAVHEEDAGSMQQNSADRRLGDSATFTFDRGSRTSRLGSKASIFTSVTRQSRLLAPIVAKVDYIPPSGPHVPLRPDGPDPLEFDKIICWLSVVWDAWRYLLIRTVLMKASSIWLYLLMVVKDFSFSYWHFGFSYMETRVLTVLEGEHREDNSLGHRVRHFLFRFFQKAIVKPFFLSKFLATTVWRTEFVFGMNEKRQNYSQLVYEEPRTESEIAHTSFRGTIRLAGGRKPTASDWASALSEVAAQKGRHTKGFVGSLCNDLWTHLVLNVRRDWRHWRNKDFGRYKHPVQHWKNRLASSKEKPKDLEDRDGTRSDALEVRYCFANECVIIRRVPAKPKTPKSRSSSRMLARGEDISRPSGESVFRRINAAWLSKVVQEIQSLIFNRSWPRLLQKIMSSSVFLATELYTEHSIVGLLPSYQETFSRFYASIRKGYNLFHDLTMICLCVFNCAAQIMNFAMLRYIRFAPICGDKRVLPDDVQQDMLMNLNLVKYWDQPDL
ncbi:hypothetical protein ACSSS7_003226 [Eimeria intestinalis]